mgnify:CR=1 FL=1
MPTLDDITILQTNNKVAMNDPVAVVDKSSSGSSQVEQFPLGLAAQGFTHAYVINYNHTAFTGNTDTAASTISQAITLHTFSATERVSVVRAVCTELFAPASGETSNGITVDVGETSDADEFIDAFDVRTGSATVNTFIDNSSSDMTGTYASPVIDDPAQENFIVTLTVGSSDNSVHINDLTAGQVVILADIFDIADYKDCVTPLHLQ